MLRYLLISLSLTVALSGAAIAGPSCNTSEPPYHYMKKVVLLSFSIERPYEVTDIPGIGQAFPRYLQKMLATNDRLEVHDGSGYSLAPATLDLMGRLSEGPSAQLKRLGKKLDAQLIITGRFLDLAILPPQSNAQAVLQPLLMDPKRKFELELVLYDSISGSEIRRFRHHTTGRGMVDMTGLEPMQSAFFATDYGQAIEVLLELISEELDGAIGCIPLTGHITGIDDDHFEIDVGSRSGLKPNDRLKVIHRRLIDTAPGGEEHFRHEAYGELVITQVEPNTAVGRLESEHSRFDLRPGDLVRAF